jgi:5-methylcytosine-specific restriction enzyme A
VPTGWQGSTRKATLPRGWTTIRRRILRRDPLCQWGSQPGDHELSPVPAGGCSARSTDVDHTASRDDHRDEVLRGLCSAHHLTRSSHQGGRAYAQAAATRKAARYRTPEQHPGR